MFAANLLPFTSATKLAQKPSGSSLVARILFNLTFSGGFWFFFPFQNGFFLGTFYNLGLFLIDRLGVTPS